MKTNGVTRVLLILLFVIGIGFVVKRIWGGSARSGVVVLEKMEQGRLYQEHFELSKNTPISLNIEAIGSFENDRVLAAYAWIVRLSDKAVVWQMQSNNVKKEHNSLAHYNGKIQLGKDKYVLYFTTYGDIDLVQHEPETFWQRILGREARSWHADADQWFLQMSIENAADQTAIAKSPSYTDTNAPLTDPESLFEERRAMGFYDKSFLFKVVKGTNLLIEMIGEPDQDYATITDASGEIVWRFKKDNTQPAGGGIRNRQFKNNVFLKEGNYTLKLITNWEHHYGNWTVNPPLVPENWGIKVVAQDPTTVKPYDIWAQPKLVDLSKAGDNVQLKQAFSLESRAKVHLYGMGEHTDKWYDFGWLKNTDSGEIVWTMQEKSGTYAGGGEKNQFFEESIELPAGNYEAHYQSDDSHSFDSWNVDAPTETEKWGLTILLLDDTVKFKSSAKNSTVEGVLLEGVTTEENLVNLTQIPNSSLESATFTLDEPLSEVHIVCLGEFSGYWGDKGWILNAKTKEIVWEMNFNKTKHAGGAAKNRKFEGAITLPRGTYEVKYITDSSYAYNDFGEYPPNDPDAWGISVSKLSKSE